MKLNIYIVIAALFVTISGCKAQQNLGENCTICFNYKVDTDCELLDYLLNLNRTNGSALIKIVFYFSEKTNIDASVTLGYAGIYYEGRSKLENDIKKWKKKLKCKK